MRVHIARYFLGDGIWLFDHLGTRLVELERTKVIESSSGVTHHFFKVVSNGTYEREKLRRLFPK